ncbi:MAG: hypothetical protein PCALPYG88_1724 [uncultured Paraburkholderia sp.]|nr:MAG: hypothetical protein PCALPYG08_5120 [uncultured Paraburkholderia sp.]CAH2916707.1 MAG: hypothetical protein PCALPYG88_1724 [uncultured Paraburkholderia sp.]
MSAAAPQTTWQDQHHVRSEQDAGLGLKTGLLQCPLFASVSGNRLLHRAIGTNRGPGTSGFSVGRHGVMLVIPLMKWCIPGSHGPRPAESASVSDRFRSTFGAVFLQ